VVEVSRSPRAMPRVAGLLTLLACLAGAEGAAAAVGLDLRWTAPAGCPEQASIRSDIEELTGRRVDPAGAEGMTVTAVVMRQTSGRWSLELTIARPGLETATRRVEGRTCGEVAKAAVSIVALALDPPLPPSPPPAKVEPPRPPRPRPPPPAPIVPRTPLRWSVFALGGIDVGALPLPAAGVGIGGSMIFGDNRFEVRATAWLPRSAELNASSGADISLFAGAIRYCRALVGTTAELSACAGFEGGTVRAEGYGLRENFDGFGGWAAPEIGALFVVRASRRFALSLEADGLAPLIRDRFRVENDQVVHRPAPVDGRALIGVRLEGL
jgi:hypothetical protein